MASRQPSDRDAVTVNTSPYSAADDDSELSTLSLRDLAERWKPNYELTAGERRIRTERLVIPKYTVTDEDGERTTFNVRELPVWAVRELIEDLASSDGDSSADAASYSEQYSWLEGLVPTKGNYGMSYGTSHGSIYVESTQGPIRYIVSDSGGKKAYAALEDVPEVEEFKPALLRHFKQQIERLRREERRAQVRKRLDQMLEEP